MNTTLSRPMVAIPYHAPMRRCPDGSRVYTFLPCRWGQDVNADLTDDDFHEDEDHVTADASPRFPLFACRYGRGVHYTLLCDGRDDCPDRADELPCGRPQHAPLLAATFPCRNHQLVPAARRCDGNSDCFDGSDEASCISCQAGREFCGALGCVATFISESLDSCPGGSRPQGQGGRYTHAPATVILSGYGTSKLLPTDCEEGSGFFKCGDSGLCIPSLLVNNGERDCPRGEDEAVAAAAMSCPGFYRFVAAKYSHTLLHGALRRYLGRHVLPGLLQVRGSNIQSHFVTWRPQALFRKKDQVCHRNKKSFLSYFVIL